MQLVAFFRHLYSNLFLNSYENPQLQLRYKSFSPQGRPILEMLATYSDSILVVSMNKKMGYRVTLSCLQRYSTITGHDLPSGSDSCCFDIAWHLAQQESFRISPGAIDLFWSSPSIQIVWSGHINAGRNDGG